MMQAYVTRSDEAVAERNSLYSITGEEIVTGNIMQFCLHYGEGNEEQLRKAYEVLKTDAKILMPLSPCEYSSLMVDFIDKYGIMWGMTSLWEAD